jgi:hypothetical protein
MTVVICQHCQTENVAGAELCVACGQPLAAAENAGPAHTGTGPVEREAVERWVRQLPEFGKQDDDRISPEDESLPAWLQTVRAHADKLTREEADDLMEFLADLKPGDVEAAKEPPTGKAEEHAKMSAELPAWVAALLPDENWPETEADSALAQHFAEAEEADEDPLPSTAALADTSPLGDSPELEGIPQMLAAEDLPEWLASRDVEEDEQPGSQEPPAWPGRTGRLRNARLRSGSPESTALEPGTPELTGPETRTPDAPAPEPARVEPEPGIEAIDSVLDEIRAGHEEALERPAGPPDDLSGFSSWMDPAQSAALEETLEEMLELPAADTSEGRVDQWLDILESLPGKPDEEQPEQAPAEAEAVAAGIPDWIQSVRAQAAEEQDATELGRPEETGPLAGLRRVVPVANITLAGGVDRSAGTLVMTKEQREQAALLRRLTSAQSEALATTGRQGTDTFSLGRLVLGGALMLVILVGLLAPGVADLLPEPAASTLPLAAVQAHEAVVASSGRTALVAFEYTPSMSGELDVLAAALLADLAANDVRALTVSQVAAGVPMAERATEATEALSTASLGYLPGEASGLRALGVCLNRGCASLAGRQLRLETTAALDDVNLIVVLAGDRDGLANWLEQVGSQSDINIIAGVTQALGPVAGPYVDSRQLAGLLEGMPVGVAYSQANQLDSFVPAEQLASVTLAQWLVIGALLVGVVYFGFFAPAAPAVGQGARK